MNYGALSVIAEKYGAKILYDESIAKYTSFGIGGVCDVIVMPNSAECAAALVSECRKSGTAYHILGKCTNVLISDKGLRGAVIMIGSDMSQIRRDGCRLICEAGASLSKICISAKNEGLGGLEFAYGIPGSAGGALYMNAGAFGGEMKDVVVYCDYLDPDGAIKRMDREEMELSYRHSVFTGSDKVILSVCFELYEADSDAVSAKMNEIMQKRRDKQPLEYPSAGSTFKRPEGYFAAKLIEDSGLKGFSVGGAQVSEKHSGFVINKENASFSDVVGVIDHVREKVFADSGVRLETEVMIVE